MIPALERSLGATGPCKLFQAHFLSIMKATGVFQEINTPIERINIYIDTQTAVKALLSNTNYSKAVKDCNEAIKRLAIANTIHLDILGSRTRKS